jgi:hypothetical protein
VVVRVLIGLLLCLSSRLAGSHRPGAHRPGSVAADGVLLADPVQRRQSGAVIAGRPPTMSGSQRRTQRAGLPASLRQQGAACTAPPCVATRSGLRCRRRRRRPKACPKARTRRSINRAKRHAPKARPLPATMRGWRAAAGRVPVKRDRGGRRGSPAAPSRLTLGHLCRSCTQIPGDPGIWQAGETPTGAAVKLHPRPPIGCRPKS